MTTREFAMAAAPLVRRLADAARRAWKDQKATVGTEDILFELTRNMPTLRREVAGIKSRLREEIAASGADGESDRESGANTVAGVDYTVAALLREAQWRARRRLRKERTVAAPTWTSYSAYAVRAALLDAHAAGVDHAHGMHVLVSILRDERNRACEILRHFDICPGKLLTKLPVARSVRADGQPWAPAVDGLTVVGTLDHPKSRVLRVLSRVVQAAAVVRWPVGIFMQTLRAEAVRQAVRAGNDHVNQAHLVVALCALEDQLQDTGRTFADRWGEHNSGGQVLANWGVDYDSSAEVVAQLPWPAREFVKQRQWQGPASDPPSGVDVVETIRKAERTATTHGHPYVGTSHLLSAVLADNAGDANRLLLELGVNMVALREDMSRYSM
jgi:hypothetical protein